MSRRVLVVGASGFVGRAALERLRALGWAAWGTYHSRPAADLEPLDANCEGSVAELLRKVAPEVVVLCSAEPHVDRCEKDPIRSRVMNVDLPRAVARACAERKVRLVYVSTDAVFPGGERDYTEDDDVAMMVLGDNAFASAPTQYGRDKAAGEVEVRQCPNSTVVRTSGVYGWDPLGKNYLMQVFTTLQLRCGGNWAAPTDQTWAPTYVRDVADVLARAAEESFPFANSVFPVTDCVPRCAHAVGRDPVTRFEFAREVARAFGLDEARVVPCSVADLKRASPQVSRSVMKSDWLPPLRGFRAGIAAAVEEARR